MIVFIDFVLPVLVVNNQQQECSRIFISDVSVINETYLEGVLGYTWYPKVVCCLGKSILITSFITTYLEYTQYR
jgi:hypothetical protein